MSSEVAVSYSPQLQPLKSLLELGLRSLPRNKDVWLFDLEAL